MRTSHCPRKGQSCSASGVPPRGFPDTEAILVISTFKPTGRCKSFTPCVTIVRVVTTRPDVERARLAMRTLSPEAIRAVAV